MFKSHMFKSSFNSMFNSSSTLHSSAPSQSADHSLAADSPLLGDLQLNLQRFAPVSTLEPLVTLPELNLEQRFTRVNQTLLTLIQEQPHESFLLAATIDYIDQVNQLQLLPPLHLYHFEYWLNLFSNLSTAEKALVRAKIAGKMIPREDYQLLFPTGMGKRHEGSHFIAAHRSPDVDTTIASFFGWIDAFAASLAQGLHHWHVPGGAPSSHIAPIFQELFGSSIFTTVANPSPCLKVSAKDLASQAPNRVVNGACTLEEMEKQNPKQNGEEGKSALLVDQQGHYIGMWQPQYAEMAKPLLSLLHSCLSWLEKKVEIAVLQPLPSELTAADQTEDSLQATLFESDHLAQDVETLFSLPIGNCRPAKEMSLNPQNLEQTQLQLLLQKGFHLKQGLLSSFNDLLSLEPFAESFKAFKEKIAAEDNLDIQLQEAMLSFSELIAAIKKTSSQLGMILTICQEVLQQPDLKVNLDSELEEVIAKMESAEEVAITLERDSFAIPLGVIAASTLKKAPLSTATLRDFCNEDEIQIASHMQIISAIDHHKAALKTSQAATVTTGDVQSCNVLTAELAFRLNDRYSVATEKECPLPSTLPSNSIAALRVQKRVLERKIAKELKKECFIHPQREYAEYLFFLYAILDDTDLLTKVSSRDIDCVQELLNRLKSLSLGYETEVVSLDHLPRDESFAKKGAEVILQNKEMHSIYQKIYDFKEKELIVQLELESKGQPSAFFADTKEQNSCCRVGQSKLFTSTLPAFKQYELAIREQFQRKAEERWLQDTRLDLHLQLISTVAGAAEVYQGTQGNYSHQDEMWIWISSQSEGLTHLASFLSAFQNAPEVRSSSMTLEVPENDTIYTPIFQQHFKAIPIAANAQLTLPIAILRYPAGALNSRKAAISPYLPKLA